MLVLVGIMVMNVNERITKLEARVEAAEAELGPLRPLGAMMSSVRPSAVVEGAYEAKQATGEPNATVSGRDSALAWCPGKENEGEEWLRLEYAEEVEAVEVRVYENFNPGAVTTVLSGEVELGSQMRPATEFSGQVFVLKAASAIKELKLIVDPAKVPGWNEIDAVALVDAAGVEHWAVKGEASSVWKKE